jgi:uncharacterized membrane protein HdeD (DUF308 family)
MTPLDVLLALSLILGAAVVFAGAVWVDYRSHQRRPPVSGRGEA